MRFSIIINIIKIRNNNILINIMSKYEICYITQFLLCSLVEFLTDFFTIDNKFFKFEIIVKFP